MKNIALLTYLVVFAIVELPRRTQSFSVTVRSSPLVGSVKYHHSFRRTTHLADADAGKVEEEPNETKTLLQKVKQAGTAGGELFIFTPYFFWTIHPAVFMYSFR
jgi:hypothetical protein